VKSPDTRKEKTMRTLSWTAATLACALIASLDAAAQTSVYKWTDADGKVHFSDTPPPPQDSKNVTEKRMGGGGGADISQLPYATQVATKNNPVTLYTAPQCGAPCADGRSLLSDRGIPYTERDAQASREDAEAVKKAIGSLQVPVLMVGSDARKGYDSGAWHAALDSAGYPRTKLPGQVAPKPVVAAPPPPPAPPPEPAPPAEAPDAAAEPPK
jgi:glutaredoxin